MNKYLKIIFSFGFISALTACGLFNPSKNQQSSMAQVEQRAEKFKILGSKGSGEPPTFGYKDYASNTVESVRNALNHLDGVEIDLQMSSDGTFWVYENQKIKDCRSIIQNFAEIDDIELDLASQCWHKWRLITLDTMLSQLKEDLTAEKIISFDLRFLNNPSAIKHFGDKKETAEGVMDKLQHYLKGEEFKVFLEVENDSIYPLLKKVSKYPVYHHQEDGKKVDQKGSIVFPLAVVKNNAVEKIRSKDFQISGVETAEDIVFAIKKGASYIQTPNVGLGEFFKKMDKSVVKDSLLFQETIDSIAEDTETLFLATIKSKDWSSDFLLNFQLDSISIESGIALVYKGVNANGDELMWKGRAIASGVSYWNFINLGALKDKGIENIEVYIVNQNKLDFQFKNMKLKILTY